jgi:hypothetical protein
MSAEDRRHIDDRYVRSPSTQFQSSAQTGNAGTDNQDTWPPAFPIGRRRLPGLRRLWWRDRALTVPDASEKHEAAHATNGNQTNPA